MDANRSLPAAYSRPSGWTPSGEPRVKSVLYHSNPPTMQARERWPTYYYEEVALVVLDYSCCRCVPRRASANTSTEGTLSRDAGYA